MSKAENHQDLKVRIDKWLWAARFYKTRQLAVKALKNGRVKLNNQTAKAASNIKLGDTVLIKKGLFEQIVIVEKISEQRGPAPQAQTLYQETQASLGAKTKLKEQLAAQPQVSVSRKKPDKRQIRDSRDAKRGT